MIHWAGIWVVVIGMVLAAPQTWAERADRDKPTMWQDAAGNYFGIVTGKPAKFRQKRDAVNEYMDGESLRIDYDGQQEIVILTNNAIMRRLEGDVLMDQVSGDRLNYNNITERYLVESGDGQGRSRMFLMPKSGTK